MQLVVHSPYGSRLNRAWHGGCCPRQGPFRGHCLRHLQREAAELPFLLVLIGMLGGLQSFGLIGLFLGPVVMATVLAVWREWIDSNERTPDSDLVNRR
jgi:hypothetical protein